MVRSQSVNLLRQLYWVGPSVLGTKVPASVLHHLSLLPTCYLPNLMICKASEIAFMSIDHRERCYHRSRLQTFLESVISAKLRFEQLDFCSRRRHVAAEGSHVFGVLFRREIEELDKLLSNRYLSDGKPAICCRLEHDKLQSCQHALSRLM